MLDVLTAKLQQGYCRFYPSNYVTTKCMTPKPTTRLVLGILLVSLLILGLWWSIHTITRQATIDSGAPQDEVRGN